MALRGGLLWGVVEHRGRRDVGSWTARRCGRRLGLSSRKGHSGCVLPPKAWSEDAEPHRPARCSLLRRKHCAGRHGFLLRMELTWKCFAEVGSPAHLPEWLVRRDRPGRVRRPVAAPPRGRRTRATGPRAELCLSTTSEHRRAAGPGGGGPTRSAPKPPPRPSPLRARRGGREGGSTRPPTCHPPRGPPFGPSTGRPGGTRLTTSGLTRETAHLELLVLLGIVVATHAQRSAVAERKGSSSRPAGCEALKVPYNLLHKGTTYLIGNAYKCSISQRIQPEIITINEITNIP